MTDDIVERLRRTRAIGATPDENLVFVRFQYLSTTEDWIHDVHLPSQAADEIERLRARLAELAATDV